MKKHRAPLRLTLSRVTLRTLTPAELSPAGARDITPALESLVVNCTVDSGSHHPERNCARGLP
jgi:hypothetical protein